MVSRSSYTSFLDAASGDLSGIISDGDGSGSNDEDSDIFSSKCREKKIIVANFLPLLAQKDLNTGRWCFSFDEDALLLQMKDGFSSETDVVYVGSLKVDVDTSEQEEVAERLLAEFNCVPTFLPPDLQKKFYHGFCKQYLWPLFHYMLPMSPEHCNRFDRFLWQAYVSANKIFADKVMEVINPEEDYLSLDSSSTVHSLIRNLRTLPVRDDILKALLNADLVGFHTFDYARHFLSCCSRMLGLNYESKRGHIGLEYFGQQIQEQFKGKKIILGVDDMDIFKGLSLKLLAMEHLLQHYEELRGELVLVQIVNPARSTGYEPVVLIDHPVPFYEKTAYYALAECCIVNAWARVNPWDIDAVADALNIAITMPEANRRAIFLDYDGTVVPQSSIKTPSPEVISILNDLCNDPKNTVWSQSSNWESRPLLMDFDWKTIADPTKESALVWHHQDADPDFGSCQAMELLDHLENVLANEPVEVKRAIILLRLSHSDGKPPDFVMCIGDDRSDEDMFESISSTIYSPSLPAPPEIFACTVGQKPSKARYYLDDSADVLKLLQGLARASSMKPKCSTQIQFSFESVA
ncbi:hypothetical protein AAG906_000618 [Vitis piasezkii]